MIINGDSIEVLKTMDEGSIDALVTDPPYGLSNITEKKTRACLSAWVNGEQFDVGGAGFMGKDWDKWTPPPELWKEVYRVMKAGAHGLVFAGSRTQDLMTLSLRLAGFEVRDTLMWLYSSDFPKSHNVSLSIDKSKGAPNRGRAIPTASSYQASDKEEKHKLTSNKVDPYQALSPEAEQWQGWGTALKPAYEPVILIRKPLEGTVAKNVLKHGTGAINIDACRVDTDDDLARANKDDKGMFSVGKGLNGAAIRKEQGLPALGRYPANVILDEEIADLLGDKQRFFYCSKANKSERDAGVDRNTHPTVKPIDLMRYLCRLITPPQGVVLDPFAGSGSTGCAAVLEGFEFIGIEREEEYAEIAQQRVEHWKPEEVGEQAQEPPSSPLDLFFKSY
jgi:site-specific DNA-methyltransferase (adenine-specific)